MNRLGAAGWRIVLLASLGGTLEFYDFVIFGVFARDIADAIFPTTSPLVSLMASFAAFATGYLARPLGGIVLSHYGDRYGRRRCFSWSVFVMSGATLGMGLVPSYAQWGIAASALMVILRLMQGFCLGGELPGALTYVVETTPRLAPFVCGVVFACVTMGVAVATAASLAVRTLLPPDLVPVYGWRTAFVLGGLAGVLSFMLRRSLEESPEFARMRALAARQPFRELLRTHAAQVLVGCAVLAGTACFTGLFFSHLPAYLAAVLKYDPREAVRGQTIAVLAHAAGILLVGWLARAYPAAVSAAGRRDRDPALRLSVLCSARNARGEPDAPSGPGGARRRTHQRIVRGRADGSLPHAHPVLGRRTVVQHRVHDLQRDVTARRDHAHSRDGPSRRRRRCWRPELHSITLIGSLWLQRYGGQVLRRTASAEDAVASDDNWLILPSDCIGPT